MSAYFIDLEGYFINDTLEIRELCIMGSNIFSPIFKVYKPLKSWSDLSDHDRFANYNWTFNNHQLFWQDDGLPFCANCILESLVDVNFKTDIFYMLADASSLQMKTVKKHFPMMRITRYTKKTLPAIPSNIKCPYIDHGQHCAYKNCLCMAIDYLCFK